MTVLLVVAVVSILVTSMSLDLQLDIQRTAALKRMLQSDQYSYGLEAWGISILVEDHQETGLLDSRREIWAQGSPPIELPEGRLRGRMVDLDGRFNLNNLFAGNRQQSVQIERFERLLAALQIDPAIAAAVLDWQDTDRTAEQSGAEDPAYLRQNPPYRAANRPFVQVSELRLVRGVDEAIYQRLKPHVAALPAPEAPTLLNINTATPEVLQSILDQITPQLAERLHQNGQAEYRNLSEFFEQPELKGVAWTQLIGTVGVDSHYFLASGAIEIDQQVQHYASLIEQTSTSFQVIGRLRGHYE